MRRLALLLALAVLLPLSAQEQESRQWVTNVSLPITLTHGLQGRHIALWQSHGRYYDNGKGCWRWQRPNLFCTTEDLYTQTIVVPYLLPMLINAGAYVFTPRERDWQEEEVYVDNDGSYPGGTITTQGLAISNDSVGFRFHQGSYRDGENPFLAGTAQTFPTSADEREAPALTYYPTITVAGEYAVYVSYPYLADAVPAVQYTVYHRGVATTFLVNQQMGYGTWVYLGTFAFAATTGADKDNCVVVSSFSEQKGTIGADALRLGGGKGNIARGGTTSGMARSFEGARYAVQWAGAPYEVYGGKEGQDDYRDDINCRGRMVNWLCGGSALLPDSAGCRVPFDVSLAVHSDAGYHDDGTTIFGSMAIATTNTNNGYFATGRSRRTSLALATALLDNLTADMTRTFGRWERRKVRDRNYSETRLPEVPAAIIETLSHQSFPDMIIGEHPLGRFTIARSIYKTLLRYLCGKQGVVVAPLTPTAFRLTLGKDNTCTLAWEHVADPSEPSAQATGYIVYTALNDGDYDNGQYVAATSCTMPLTPGVQYSFRVAASNSGGQSLPTSTLSAYLAPKSRGTILIVDAFERLSAPYIIDNDSVQGFDLLQDEGVPYGRFPGFVGRQTYFGKEAMGKTGMFGLGASDDSLAGQFIMGNTFDYTREHCQALVGGDYNVVSCTLAAITSHNVTSFAPYAVVDILFGLQQDDGQLGLHYKTFTPALQTMVAEYAQQGGKLFISGAYIGSDMLAADEQAFLSKWLKVQYRQGETRHCSNEIRGLGRQFTYYHSLNSSHYAATHPDVLSPTDDAICAMLYADGTSAAVGYKGSDYAVFTMAFPFETITEASTRRTLLRGILTYLTQ